MAKFYFTYGTDLHQPFYGGWTVVEAPDSKIACEMFRAYHPDRSPGLLNCAEIYTEAAFNLTAMNDIGNFGSRCHEIIRLERSTTK